MFENDPAIPQEQRLITGYLIDVQNEKAGAVTIQHGLTAYYQLLNCRCIDMVSRRIGKQAQRCYTIICDDEGLFAPDPQISAIDSLGQVMLVGNLLVVKVDADGETQSLDDDDIRYLQKHTLLFGTTKHPKPYPMLCFYEYV